jgi:DNA-binding LacI/PurR family transcriptional regulator
VSRMPEDTDEVAARKLLSGIADGVVLASWARSGVVERLLDSHLPVVQYPFRPGREIPSVAIDQAPGALQALEYLAKQGHKHILYRSHRLVGESRRKCFEQAAEKTGIRLNVIVLEPDGKVSPEEESLLTAEPGKRPTAAACWNDEFAYKLLDYCDERGIRVPQDLAVVGFDGLRTFPRLRRKLTTVYVPWSDVARTAVNVLVDICNGVTVPRDTLLPVELRIGDTA